ncbi:ATP-binding protein [Isoptericola cucumis]|uniref:ATP-binding protein n=1 Tax=Isoptericola cucumis TaxID=1776856 RepID=UPI0032086154
MKLDEVIRALDRIHDGETADAIEGDSLEFKQDPATVDATHRSKNPRAELVQVLVGAAVCMANGDGGALVVGVADKVAGPAALVGTDAEPDDIRRKIFSNTRPSLTVGATELEHRGVRFVVIDVPQGLDLHTDSQGRATRRSAARCEPLSESERFDLSFRRRNPDFSARQSSATVADVDDRAIAEARRLLRAFPDLRAEMAALSVDDLLRSLGVVDEHDHLTVAGEVLFVRPERHTVVYLARDTPGGDPYATRLVDPMVLALPELLDRIRRRGEAEIGRIALAGGQEIAIPDFPPLAVDEAVANAFLHRDWRGHESIVVDHSPQILRVWSPGGLPPGVDVDRLLSTVSRPRNAALMSAVTTLGLAEQSSRGIDRMYREMIRTGRDGPVFTVDDLSVEVTFTSGAPNRSFARFVLGLPEELQLDVNVLLVLRQLCRNEKLTLSTTARVLQVSDSIAERVLEAMATGRRRLVARTGERTTWTLSPEARAELGSAVTYRARADDSTRQVVAHVGEYGWITNRTIRNMFALDVQQARAVLDRLRSEGILIKDPEGPERGPGIRWVPGDSFPHRRRR